MKPPSAEVLESLAAEYVLGLLKGRARQRFERWMMASYKVRQEVWYWERQLNVLAEQVSETPPPQQVWQNIEQRLWGTPASTAKPSGLGFWRGWSLLATAAVLVLALFIGLRPQPELTPEWLAVVQSPQAEPLWMFNGSDRQREFELKAVGATSAGVANDFELWILPSAGNPISMGLLPTNGGRLTIELSAAQMQALLQSKTLAISLEPKGGSPTGQPTGPVLYTTRLLKL